MSLFLHVLQVRSTLSLSILPQLMNSRLFFDKPQRRTKTVNNNSVYKVFVLIKQHLLPLSN